MNMGCLCGTCVTMYELHWLIPKTFSNTFYFLFIIMIICKVTYFHRIVNKKRKRQGEWSANIDFTKFNQYATFNSIPHTQFFQNDYPPLPSAWKVLIECIINTVDFDILILMQNCVSILLLSPFIELVLVYSENISEIQVKIEIECFWYIYQTWLHPCKMNNIIVL